MDVFDLFAKLGLDSSEYEQGLDKAKSLAGKVGSGIASGLKTVAKAGAAAVTAATAATTKFAADAISVGQDFDKSMSQVAATMGLSMDEMADQVGEVDLAWGTFSGDLREYAQEMGRNTAFSATQAADALNYMALAGYDVQTSMEMLPNVLSLAAAGNMDLARASDMVTDAATAMGMVLEDGTVDIERVTLMVDEMAKAASTGNTSVEQLGDAFLVVGGLAKELNGGMVTLEDGTQATVDGVEELEIALTAMANAGIKGSEAGTHMRNMLLKLSSPTEAGATALENLGISVFDTEGNMRSLKDIFQDLNTVMDTGAVDQLKASYEKLASMEVPLSKVADSYKEWGSMSLVKKNEEGKEVLKTWEEIEAEMNNVISAEGGLTQSEKLSVISDLFNTRDVASAEALLAAVNQDWDNIGESILDAQGSAQKMADTQLDNLAGDITLFKSALEGAQIAVSDQLTPSLREFVEFGTDSLSKVTGAFKEGGLTGAMEAFGEVLAEGLNMIIEEAPKMVDAGMKLLEALGKGLLDNLPVIVDAASDILINLTEGLIENLPTLIDAAIEIISVFGENLLEHLPELMEKLGEMISKITEKLGDPETLQGFVDGAAQMIVTLANGLIEALPTLIPAIIDVILNIVDALTKPDTLVMLIDAALQLIVALAQGLIDALPNLIERLPEIVENIVQALIDSAPMLLDAAIELIGVLVEGVYSNIYQIIAVGVDIIFALIDGIVEMLPQLVAEMPKLILRLVEAIIKSLPKIIEGGAKIVGALIKGITNMLGSLAKSGLSFVTTLIKGIAEGFYRLINAGKEIVDNVKEGFTKKLEDAKTWGSDLIGNFIGGIKEKWNALKDTVSGIGQGIKDFLGFSEPKKGPLSDFHTYAPDMMELFAKGIEDNKKMLLNTVADAFNFSDIITDDQPQLSLAGAGSGVTNVTMNIYGAEGQDVNELAEIISQKLGAAVKRSTVTWSR